MTYIKARTLKTDELIMKELKRDKKLPRKAIKLLDTMQGP